MISFLLASIIQVPTIEYNMENVPENVAKYCSKQVGIPYASDNFTDEEWNRYKNCVRMTLKKK